MEITKEKKSTKGKNSKKGAYASFEKDKIFNKMMTNDVKVKLDLQKLEDHIKRKIKMLSALFVKNTEMSE